jgi:hypothetical protein
VLYTEPGSSQIQIENLVERFDGDVIESLSPEARCAIDENSEPTTPNLDLLEELCDCSGLPQISRQRKRVGAQCSNLIDSLSGFA